MKDTSKKALRRGHNEGNIRQRTDGRWEVRLSAGIDYKTGKPRRTSTCCNTRQEAIAVLQQQAHEVRTQGWRDPMSVTLGEWYEYWNTPTTVMFPVIPDQCSDNILWRFCPCKEIFFADIQRFGYFFGSALFGRSESRLILGNAICCISIQVQSFSQFPLR